MADQAQGADVLEVALPAPFCYRENVVRIPQRFATDPFQTPALQKFQPVDSSRALQVQISSVSVDTTQDANAAVA
jgi:hypothetical protein